MDDKLHGGVSEAAVISQQMFRALKEKFGEAFDVAKEEGRVIVQQGGDILHPKAGRRHSGPHPWLHPTKGWRDNARPRKTNRRRRLSEEARRSLTG
jgi:hypothetical protein